MASSIVIVNTVKFNNYAGSANKSNAMRANEILEDKITELKSESMNIGTQLGLNPIVIKAIEEKNSDKILNDLKDILKNSKVEFVTVTDEKGNVLARTHEPDKK